MLIGGFDPFSAIDYPNKMCAIIFTEGCNLRCPFCHNRELVIEEEFPSDIPFSDIFGQLEKRKSFLDAVEFTGGEPLLHSDLLYHIKVLKNMGYLVKLDTNGTLPDELLKVIPYVDYVAIDIKAPPSKYAEATGVSNIKMKKIKDSIDMIKIAAKDYEFRTTAMKNFIQNDEDIVAIGELIRGAKRYYIQRPQSKNMLDTNFVIKNFSDEELKHFKDIISGFVKEVNIR